MVKQLQDYIRPYYTTIKSIDRLGKIHMSEIITKQPLFSLCVILNGCMYVCVRTMKFSMPLCMSEWMYVCVCKNHEIVYVMILKVKHHTQTKERHRNQWIHHAQAD